MYLNGRNFHIVCAFTVYFTCFKLMWISQCLLEKQSKYTLLWITVQAYSKILSYNLKQHPKNSTNHPLFLLCHVLTDNKGKTLRSCIVHAVSLGCCLFASKHYLTYIIIRYHKLPLLNESPCPIAGQIKFVAYYCFIPPNLTFLEGQHFS